MDPDVDDLMCYEETQVRRKIYRPLAAGSRLLDFESPPNMEETPLVMNQLREGVWMPAGTRRSEAPRVQGLMFFRSVCARVGVCFVNDRPDPTDEEIENAIRSQPAYQALSAISSIDVHFEVGSGINHTVFPPSPGYQPGRHP
jgi:hypothetical protein